MCIWQSLPGKSRVGTWEGKRQTSLIHWMSAQEVGVLLASPATFSITRPVHRLQHEYWIPGSSILSRFIPEIINLTHDSLCSLACSPPISRRATSLPLLSYQKLNGERVPGTWNVTDSEDMIKYLNWQNYIPLVTFSTVCLSLSPSFPASPRQLFPLWTRASQGSVLSTLLPAKCFLFSTTRRRPSHQLLIKWSMNMQISPHTHFIKLNKKEETTWHAQEQNRWWGGLLQGRRGKIGTF